VQLPPFESFTDAESYCATLLHSSPTMPNAELCHDGVIFPGVSSRGGVVIRHNSERPYLVTALSG